MTEELPISEPLSSSQLFRRLADGQLTSDEFRAVEAKLAADPTFRADYVRFMDLEASLYEELSMDSRQAPSPVTPFSETTLSGQWFSRGRLSLMALCLSLVLVAGLFWFIQPRSHTRFLEAQLKGLEDAAVVTHSSEIRQDPNDRPLRVGTRLKPGVLELRQGELQIDFLCGARVLLRAPAELHVLSSTAATLVSGSVAARVTEGAGKFVLGAPDAAIVDLGTEFAVNVDSKGDSEVHVFDGEVEVSLLGDDGNTLFSQRLLEQETVHIDRTSRTVRPSQTKADSFATVRELDRSALHVTPAYVAAVRRSRPILYWRFESLENGLVKNEVAPQEVGGQNGGTPEIRPQKSAPLYNGRIVTSPDAKPALIGPPPISVSEGVAHFAESETFRYLTATEPLVGVNRKSFTMEFWINPETFHWATVVNLMVPDKEGRQLHLGLIELAHDTPMVHKASVVRFLHRHPPGDHTWGWNLFSPETCTPGRWTHVVTVKEPDELQLFVNGVLVRRVQGEETAGSDADPYLFTVGQFGTLKPQRQFRGMLDELAIYNRALSEVEVSEHYWMMISDSKPVEELP